MLIMITFANKKKLIKAFIFLLKKGEKMIPIYDVNNLTGNLDIMFKNAMQIGFTTTITCLTIWLIVSLLIWLFRSQKEI